MPSNLLVSAMDTGPSKVRRRGSATPGKMNVSFKMTTAATKKLETFIRTILGGGAKAFEFPHPRLDKNVKVRIMPKSDTELYEINFIAPGLWKVDFTFEVFYDAPLA